MGLLAFDYIIWHYSKAVRDIFTLWGNFLWFGYHYFSFSVLLRTLFKPFRRVHESYSKGLEIGKLLENLLFNIAVRAIGFMLRSFVLLTGILFELMIIAGGIVTLVAWLLLPVLIVGLYATGVIYLINAIL